MKIDCPNAAIPRFPCLLMQGAEFLPRGKWHVYATAIGISTGEASREGATSARDINSFWDVEDATALAQIRLSDEGEIPYALHAWTERCRVHVYGLGDAIKYGLWCTQDSRTLGTPQVSYPLHTP